MSNKKLAGKRAKSILVLRGEVKTVSMLNFSMLQKSGQCIRPSRTRYLGICDAAPYSRLRTFARVRIKPKAFLVVTQWQFQVRYKQVVQLTLEKQFSYVTLRNKNCEPMNNRCIGFGQLGNLTTSG